LPLLSRLIIFEPATTQLPEHVLRPLDGGCDLSWFRFVLPSIFAVGISGVTSVQASKSDSSPITTQTQKVKQKGVRPLISNTRQLLDQDQSRRISVLSLNRLFNRLSGGAVKVTGAYRVGPGSYVRTAPCPLSIRGRTLRCTGVTEIEPVHRLQIRRYYREQHGFINFGCIDQPCLFTTIPGIEIAQVPITLTAAIKSGGYIISLTARSADGQIVKSYVFLVNGTQSSGICMHPAADSQMTGESNMRACEIFKEVF